MPRSLKKKDRKKYYAKTEPDRWLEIRGNGDSTYNAVLLSVVTY